MLKRICSKISAAALVLLVSAAVFLSIGTMSLAAPVHATSANVTAGMYRLKNVASGRYMNYAYGWAGREYTSGQYAGQNYKPIIISDGDGTQEQIFQITYAESGKYWLGITTSHGGVVNIYQNGTAMAGKEITRWILNANSNLEKFYLTSVGNGNYIIQSASDPNIVIAPNSTEHRSQLYSAYYNAGDAKQLWKLEPTEPCKIYGHTYKETVTPATATADGKITRKCSVCGQVGPTTVLPKTGTHAHTYSTTVKKATPAADGKITKKCSGCGHIVTTVIVKPKSVLLSGSAYLYDGKVHRPKVTVKDSKDKVISGSQYTVTYSSGCKKIGTYTVKIVFKGSRYKGTVKKTYKIIKNSFKVYGVVSDAATGKVLKNATLKFRKGNAKKGTVYKSCKSNSSGAYKINLPKGTYTAAICKPGYITTYIVITVVKSTSSTKNNAGTCSISKKMPSGNWRIVLTWGKTPNDLDSHLVGNYKGMLLHTYYASRNAYGGSTLITNLDVDDVSSYGPETVTLKKVSGGHFKYYVHNYTDKGLSSSKGLANSKARVVVYKGNRQVATYKVPKKSGTKWYVFEIKNGKLIRHNSMSYASTSGDIHY